MTEVIWQLQICVCERGIGWFFEKCGSRKTLAWSQNLGSVCDSSQSLLFRWFCLSESQFFLSFGLEFWNPGLAVSCSLEFTILYVWGKAGWLWGGGGGGRGGWRMVQKRNFWDFRPQLFNGWIALPQWLNLCLCPVDDAVGFPDAYLLDGTISLFNNTGQIWHIPGWGLNKSDQQSPWSFLWSPHE